MVVEEAYEPELTFRRMQAEDIDAVYKLIMSAFGDVWPNLAINVSRREHLEWKMNPPQGGPSDAHIALIGSRIIGYNGRSRRDVWVRGRQHHGSSGGDVCIDPAFQDRGFMAPWREYRNEQQANEEPRLNLSEGSTHPRLIRSSKRRGGRVLAANHLERLTLPISFAAVALRQDGNGAAFGPRTFVRAVRTSWRVLASRVRYHGFDTPAPELTVSSVGQFDERADTLWASARDSFDFAVIRSRDYLNWRFCDPRAGVYRVRAVEDGDQLLGYMVTGSIGRAAQVVDMLAAPGRTDAIRALVDDAVAHARSSGATSLTVQMPHVHPYREVFVRSGFILMHRVRTFGFRRRDNNAELDFVGTDPRARLHVALGDTDHI